MLIFETYSFVGNLHLRIDLIVIDKGKLGVPIKNPRIIVNIDMALMLIAYFLDKQLVYIT